MQLKNIKVEDIMTRPVISAKRSASARDVAMQLLTGMYSGMPVTDDEGRIIGVITEFDLLSAVGKGKELVRLTAGDVMSKQVVSADVATPVAEVVKIMQEKHVIRLPITQDEKLVGIIARSDVLRSLIEPEFVSYM